jgi:hypothetical protein
LENPAVLPFPYNYNFDLPIHPGFVFAESLDAIGAIPRADRDHVDPLP